VLAQVFSRSAPLPTEQPFLPQGGAYIEDQKRRMSMAYQFTKDLETGNPLIDREHRELFEAINRLLDACHRGAGRDEVSKAVRFLQSYVNKHMTHRLYHESYKVVVGNLVAKLEREGPTITLVSEVNTSIAGWLAGHIRSEDKKFAAYLKRREEQERKAAADKERRLQQTQSAHGRG
jgi:hemerythrin